MADDVKLVFAGIYKYSGVPFDQTDFAINYNGSLCYLHDGITDIFSDVEHGFSGMELVEGYSLGVLVKEGKWQIRNSGMKHLPDYIIGEGTFQGNFVDSLKSFFKVLS